MAQPLKGTLVTARKADDTLVFRAKFRTVTRTLGEEPDWDRKRAQTFLNKTLLPAASAGLPWWDLIPGPQTEPAAVTVIDSCTEFVTSGRARHQNKSTLNALESPVVKHLLPYFAYEDDDRERERALSSVDEALVEQFVTDKQHERDVLRDLPDVLSELDDETLSDPELVRAQLDQEEWELLYRYGQRGGRRPLSDLAARGRISLSSRGLSNNEINRCLTRLRRIVLDIGNRRHRLGLDDPTIGRFLPRDRPNRDWLHPHQFQALLDAARQLDSGGARVVPAHTSLRNGCEVPIAAYSFELEPDPARTRESALLMLGLCAPRVSEFCAMVWALLYGSGLDIPRAKTAAGERSLELPTIVRAALDERRKVLGAEASEYIWATQPGNARDRNNVRNRLLAPVLEVAAGLLEERGQRRLPERVTPHTLRRTAMTYWAWAGRSQTWAMQQAGHSSSKMTLEAYQQAYPPDPEQKSMVLAWLAGLSE